MIGDGWNKDGDYNTAFSKTVLPLPSHQRPGYDGPLDALEDDPVYRFHPDDWREYHTRYVTPDEFHDAAQAALGKPGAIAQDGVNAVKRFARVGVIVLFIGLLVALRVLNNLSDDRLDDPRSEAIRPKPVRRTRPEPRPAWPGMACF